jgi:hypothetical protein
MGVKDNYIQVRHATVDIDHSGRPAVGEFWCKAGLVGIVVSLVLAGCANTSSTAPTTAKSSSSATIAAPSTAAAPPPVTSVQLEADTWKSFGHFLIMKDSHDDRDPLGRVGDAHLYLPQVGQIDLDANKLMPGKDVVFRRYVSSGSAASPMIAGVIELNTPSHELEPAAIVATLVLIDPRQRKIVKQTEIGRFQGSAYPDYSGSVDALVGSLGGVVAYSIHDPTNGAFSETRTQTVGFDFATNKEVWRKPGIMVQAVFDVGGAVIQTGGKTAPGQIGNFCLTDTAVDVATGQEVFTLDGRALQPDPNRGCADLGPQSFPQEGVVFVTVDTSNVAVSRKGVTTYDFLHKRNLNLDQDTVAMDPRSDLVVVTPEADGGLQVRDAVSGSVVWSMDKAKADSLGLMPKSLFHRQLWVETSDERLLLDPDNGNIISKNWVSYPQATVADWVLDSQGKLAKA